MKIKILFLGKTKEAYLAEGIADFASRLKHFTKIEIIELKDLGKKKNLSNNQIMEGEGNILLNATTKNSLLVALDSRGRMKSSEDFSQIIQEWEQQGTKDITFVIGGSLGLDPTVKAKAHYLLSLSKMTFTHEMVRLLLMEQLFRAYSIKEGTKYHK